MAKEVITITRCDLCSNEINQNDIKRMRIDWITESQFAMDYEICPICHAKMKELFKLPPKDV